MKEDLKKFERLKKFEGSRVRKFEGSKDFKQIRMFSNDFKQCQTISNNVKQQTKHG
jgi:hypothetical protein